MTSKTFTSGTVIDSAWLNDVNSATYNGSSVYTPAGTGAVATTVQSKLRKFTTSGDHTSSAQDLAEGNANPLILYNTITLARNSLIEGFTVTGSPSGSSTFMRAYTDSTNFYSTTTGGYTSYDTIATIGNGTSDPHYNHSYGYEARHTFQGNNGIDNLFGFYSGVTINGLPGGSTYAATNCLGFVAGEALGTGTIGTQAGFYCNDLTRGSNNYGAYFAVSAGTNKYNIYSIGSAPSLFNGNVKLGIAGGTIFIDTSGATTSGFKLHADANLVVAGTTGLVSMSATDSTSVTKVQFVINASVLAVTCPVRTGSYTVATLPVVALAGVGGRAFVTDATVTTFASVVVGGGANGVPVYSDGTNWRIG